MTIKKFKYSKLVAIVAVINIIQAVVALLKDMTMASYFGTNAKADAFTLAFFLTDTLGNNLIASTLAVICIPFFTKAYTKNDESELYDDLKLVNISFSILTIILAFGLFVFKNQIIGNFSGFTRDTKTLCIQLLIILLPTIMLYPVVNAGVSYLQVKGEFIISSLPSVLFNFVFLLGISYCLTRKISVNNGIYIVSCSVLAAALAMVVFVYWKIIKDKIKDRRVHKQGLTGITKVYKLFIPYFAVLLLSQIILYYERYLASLFHGGSVAALNYAYRLSQFPIWVFVSAIGTVLFPKMAKHNSEGDIKALNLVFENAILWVFILTMPVMFMLYILRVPIISILFLRGAFNSISLKFTAEILAGYSFAIIGQSISALCIKLYLAKDNIRTPLIIYIVSTIFNIILDTVLVSKIGIKGVGYGAAISSIINAAFMIYGIKPDVKDRYHNIILRLMKCCISNFILICVCFLGNEIWNFALFKMNIFLQLISIGFICILSISFYGLSIKLFKVF